MQKSSFFKGGLLRIDFTSTINNFSLLKYSKEITVRDAYSFVLGHYETNTRRLKVSFRHSTHENAEISFVVCHREDQWQQKMLLIAHTYLIFLQVCGSLERLSINCFRELNLRHMIIYRIYSGLSSWSNTSVDSLYYI